ncbi:MAG: hypothetical protein AAB777_01045 [Patescibacteria group bacterium]
MESDLDNLIKTVAIQEERKSRCINLIASENIISDRVSQLQASLLSNRYILNDFPNNKELFEIKEKLKQHLCKMFNVKYVNISPLSGMSCMSLIISSLTDKNDNIYTLKPLDGGHASTEKICRMYHLNINYLPFSNVNYRFNLEEIEKTFEIRKPRLIYLDNTIISFYSPVDGLKKLAEKYHAPIVYDGSHVLGLIAGKSFPNPIENGGDILSGSTHKTFFGSQKGIILTNNQDLINKIDSISNDYISSLHTGSLLALYMSVLEMERFGNEYAMQVVKNAKALGKNLAMNGVAIPTLDKGVTETHQVWIDTGALDPQRAFEMLAECNINTNSIRIPAIQKIGLRLGTAEVTRLGMKEDEMKQIAKFISEVLTGSKKKNLIKEDVIRFSSKYQKILFTLDNYNSNVDRSSMIKENEVILDQRFETHDILNNTTFVEYGDIVNKYVKEFFSIIPGFQGLIIRGGVGRGTADDLSDIDFTCVFDCDDIEKIKKQYGLKTGMYKYNGIMFSGRYISLNSFRDSLWSPKMKHAYSYVKLIHCAKTISDIIKKKTKISISEQKRRLVENVIELGEICRVYNEYHGFKMFSEIYKQYSRKEFLVANLEIDRAVRYIKNIIFDLNKINYPEEKSYYTKFFSGLPKQPDGFDHQIKTILQMPRDDKSFGKRLTLLVILAREVLGYCEKYISLPKDIYKFYLN